MIIIKKKKEKENRSKVAKQLELEFLMGYAEEMG